jgi:hypothetical protein
MTRGASRPNSRDSLLRLGENEEFLPICKVCYVYKQSIADAFLVRYPQPNDRAESLTAGVISAVDHRRRDFPGIFD